MKSKKSKLVQICEGVINTSSHDLSLIEHYLGKYLDRDAITEFHNRASAKMDEMEDQIDDIILDATHELAADAAKGAKGNTDGESDVESDIVGLAQEYMHKLVASRFASK